MTTPYDADKFTGLRPWSNEEPTDEFKDSELADDQCWYCPHMGPLSGSLEGFDCCAACLMAFEEADAPEELHMTLDKPHMSRDAGYWDGVFENE